MVGELFLAISGLYIAAAIGTVIWYYRRQRRDQNAGK